MGALLGRLEVPRTNVADQNPIKYDGDLGGQEFNTPSHRYFGKQWVPVENQWSDGSPSFMAPVSHFHLLQTETFHIDSGSGLWYIKGKTIRLDAGDTIIIPRFVAHRFINLPGSKEPLVFSWRYDSQYWEMEERFFRNTLTYLDDCRKAAVAPSILQLCVFLADCWMPGEFIPCRGGDYINCAVNTLLTSLLAFIGRVLYGYKGSYPEYYDPAISRKRIAEGSKKCD
ncbi:hypothetical protein LTR37_015211 [Vermiconidia calcicola]|uniref:Uncharacterized protein n=1 Tax=Vermiconidia calcicola TaxID=1690605 RepID=A0ACC3MSZ4_9PEZI|nr:hypothetical protein LTR37_015211 [Vermiconidia calcicola]